MGDSGEGLVDAEARIQERMEELRSSRKQVDLPAIENPELIRKLESLKLARTEIAHQLETVAHPARRNQLAGAMADVERRIAEIEQNPG
jgi:hypothetical protein